MPIKKNVKKSIVSFLSVILAVIIAFGGCLAFRFYGNVPKMQNSYDEIYSDEQISLNVPSNGIFSILKINDTHFFNGKCDRDIKTLHYLKKVLERTPCDLIIVDGDLVDGFNLKPSYDKYNAISEFAQLIESYNIPWTFAPGNNDGEIDGDNEDVITYMMRYDHFICRNDHDIDGSMQFFIDLKYKNSLAHSIAILDSNARKIRAIGPYDYIKESQAQWLVDNMRDVKTSVFFHMPTPAFEEAYNEGIRYAGFPFSDAYPIGDIKENKLFDNLIENHKNITLLSAAHIHSDNMCSYYNDRYYQLSSFSGYTASHDESMPPSCTYITIDVKQS